MAAESKPNERMAPGHKFLDRLGSGIKWQPGVARLYERGEIAFEAEHQAQSPYQFWHELVFVDAFPQVTHWWFHSAWTQRVRLTRAEGLLENSPATIYGYMQFIDEDQPGQLWTITERDVPVVETPYPPNEAKPVNLPLRLALARLVVATLTDDVITDQWLGITSLVQGEQLAQALPTRRDALPFRLAGIETDLRAAFCRLQGIQPG
jgi:hypothetical protein